MYVKTLFYNLSIESLSIKIALCTDSNHFCIVESVRTKRMSIQVKEPWAGLNGKFNNYLLLKKSD